MRVSGRKLRLAVGTGIAALMLTLGVSSVGATAPQSTGGIVVIVTGGAASATRSDDVTETNANYRNAISFTNSPVLAGNSDDCGFFEIGNNTNADTVLYGPATGSNCGGTQPRTAVAAYPLWENQKGTGPIGNVTGTGRNTFIVPITENPRNGTIPARVYVVESFR